MELSIKSAAVYMYVHAHKQSRLCLCVLVCYLEALDIHLWQLLLILITTVYINNNEKQSTKIHNISRPDKENTRRLLTWMNAIFKLPITLLTSS